MNLQPPTAWVRGVYIAALLALSSAPVCSSLHPAPASRRYGPHLNAPCYPQKWKAKYIDSNYLNGALTAKEAGSPANKSLISS